jgi:transcription elongation factor Elf1
MSAPELPQAPEQPFFRLCDCPECRRDFVIPIEYEKDNDDDYQPATLECQNCGWSEAGTYALSLLEQFSDQLDEIENTMNRQKRKIVDEEIESRVAVFSQALEQDLILPQDFVDAI